MVFEEITDSHFIFQSETSHETEYSSEMRIPNMDSPPKRSANYTMIKTEEISNTPREEYQVPQTKKKKHKVTSLFNVNYFSD